MKWLLLITWFTPGTDVGGTAQFAFPTVEHCQGAAMFAGALIEKIPTPEGVKFTVECRAEGDKGI